jgi:hypothetical protein
MSTTLQQLEQKLNIMQVVRDNPWPALALAVGAGVLLSGSRTDVRAAAATVAATKGASSRVGTVLDDVVANLVGGLHDAFQSRITSLVDDLTTSIGAPVGQRVSTNGPADVSSPRSSSAGSSVIDRGDVRSTVDGSGGLPARAD